jgi:hypothetical protein
VGRARDPYACIPLQRQEPRAPVVRVARAQWCDRDDECDELPDCAGALLEWLLLDELDPPPPKLPACDDDPEKLPLE